LRYCGYSTLASDSKLATLTRSDSTDNLSFVTQPNMYARGILFGTMKYELGDHAYIRCPETGLVADLEFKTRGYFSGTYNAIGGFIKDAQGKQLFELSGLWNEEMYIKDLTVGATCLVEMKSCLHITDRQERDSLRCFTRQAQPSASTTTTRARRA
jgi:hypothetical protein